MTPLRYEYADKIRYYRRQRRLSQQALSELAGLGPQTVGQIERRERGGDFGTIERIFNALGRELVEREAAQ